MYARWPLKQRAQSCKSRFLCSHLINLQTKRAGVPLRVGVKHLDIAEISTFLRVKNADFIRFVEGI